MTTELRFIEFLYASMFFTYLCTAVVCRRRMFKLNDDDDDDYSKMEGGAGEIPIKELVFYQISLVTVRVNRTSLASPARKGKRLVLLGWNVAVLFLRIF